ncbi:amidase [Colletotrichum scovillei]|uniref:Amidase family protein n=1 Tax=Colletotrichum scovillei TaxID=1209932 RepID=A0A9P7QUJ3_9PEZI|nr:amidase [Colletotrichum scovillei]KAF4785797.1 amidase [Colletotrichum scovillei]KAG7038120.1 amidase family protein [Colletotrichum scovillei]KAG7040461.1 amidase family protein [Colletotrichum scovillei]KAG7060509.1 amidase family protein [Colletotrichum scovillei]
MEAVQTLNITEATISQLQDALIKAQISSVDLVARFLHRIGKLDHRGPAFNSVCIINPKVFDEAQASDAYRASGRSPRPLEGIPFTVKDSYKVEGLTVAAASPAFESLVASSDAAVVELLRAAGAVLIGKTTMPPMADGGSQRGLYGRSISPYNPEYLCTSFASGSSYGSAVSTTCSFAPIGLGGETVSSGRAPASHNALVGYSPSRGVIPSRGHWPLYPTCDVVAPHTKSVADMLALLNAIVADDAHPRGDFWREQTVVPIPPSSKIRSRDFSSLKDPEALRGKHVAVPKCYIGKQTSSGYSVVCSEATRQLWEQARVDLETLGAKITETDFPLVERYSTQLFLGQAANVPGIPSAWIDIERCQMIATAWDDFLRNNSDPECPSLEGVDYSQINPDFAPLDDRSEHTEQQNHVRYAEMIEFIRNRPDSIYDLPGCADALIALEEARKRDLEHWMDENGFDVVVFPTNGDVGRADSEDNRESMAYSLRDGLKYSNGNRAMKHLGVPAITVPMGSLSDKKIPVGLTFAGKAWSDSDLLRYAYAFESSKKRRESPSLAPQLDTDLIQVNTNQGPVEQHRKLDLIVSCVDVEEDTSTETLERRHVALSGFLEVDNSSEAASMQVFVNGDRRRSPTLKHGQWGWSGILERDIIKERYPVQGKVARDQFMVVVLAQTSGGASKGRLVMID